MASRSKHSDRDADSRLEASAFLATRRQVLGAAAALGGTAFLAACGGGISDSTSPGAGGASGAIDTSKPFKIGFVGSSSGPAASAGPDYVNGTDLWLSRNPTILGRKVVVVKKDDASTADGGIKAARSLVDEEQVEALVGPFLSTAATGILPIVAQAKILNVVDTALPDAGDPTKYPFTFQIEGQKKLEAPAELAKVKAMGMTKLGLLVVDNPLGQTSVDAINANLAGSGVTITDVEKFPSGSTDVTAQVAKLLASNPEVIMVNAAVSGDYLATLKAIESAGFQGRLIGNSAIVLPSSLKTVSPAFAARILGTGYPKNVLEDTMSDKVKQIRVDLKAMLKIDTLVNGLYTYVTAYDALDVLRIGIEGAKSFDPATVSKWLESNPVDGVKQTYHFSSTSHLGIRSEDLGWAVGGSFKDGSFRAAS